MIIQAWSTFEIKSADDDKRIIEGIASTPTPDMAEDIVEPMGGDVRLPLPFIWQHDLKMPIGNVTAARFTEEGIPIRAEIERGIDYIDRAWEQIKRRLVRGLSLGFKSLEDEPIKGSFGRRILKWQWLELSAVTIPMNQDATILAIKALDQQQQRAASGNAPLPVVRLGNIRPGDTGNAYVIKKVHRLK